MALSVSARVEATSSISMSESYTTAYATTLTEAGSSSASRSILGGTTITYVNGTGSGAIDMGATLTGNLTPGGTTVIDFTSFPSRVFDETSNLNFDSIKNIVITNSWAGPTGGGYPSGFPCDQMAGLCIGAIGVDGFTGLFNAETGNMKIRPFGSWTYSDWCGVSVGAGNKELSLIDCDGSGVSYEVTVVGVTGLA